MRRWVAFAMPVWHPVGLHVLGLGTVTLGGMGSLMAAASSVSGLALMLTLALAKNCCLCVLHASHAWL